MLQSAYCSLEQWSTGKCDGRGDIYSLGMTLDEMVTGQQRSITVGMGVGGDCTRDAGAGAVRFNALLRSMTHVFAAGRPATMTEVSAELSSILASR